MAKAKSKVFKRFGGKLTYFTVKRSDMDVIVLPLYLLDEDEHYYYTGSNEIEVNIILSKKDIALISEGLIINTEDITTEEDEKKPFGEPFQ